MRTSASAATVRRPGYDGGGPAPRSTRPRGAGRRRAPRSGGAPGPGPAGRSACTCTSRSACGAATTATSRRGPTARTWSTPTSTPASTDLRRRPASDDAPAAGDERVLRRGHAVGPDPGPARPDPGRRSTATADAEVTAECNPDGVDRERLAATVDAGREPAELRRPVDGRPRAGLARPDAPARERRPGGRRPPATPASRPSTSTSSTGPRVSRSTTGRPPSTAPSRSDPPHVSAYALTVEAGTPLAGRIAAGDAAAPDDDDQAAKYDARRRPPRRRRAGLLRDLELGPPRPRVPAQPPVLAPARLPRDRLRGPRPHRTAGAGGRSARPSATSAPSSEGATRSRVTSGSTRTDRAEEALALALRTRDGVVLAAPADERTGRRVDAVVAEVTDLALVERDGDPAVLRLTRPGASSPTTSPPASWPRAARAAGHGRLAGTR